MVFKVVIELTPIAGAPIQINTETRFTDENGEATASVSYGETYSIASGLEAIDFTPRSLTGADIAAQSPMVLEATRLVSSSDVPCRVLVGGVSNLYFPTSNITDRSLTVPLEYSALNSMYSVTGEAVPAEVFAAGDSGFSVPESHFAQNGSLTGIWKFLGQDVVVGPTVNTCADRGVPGSCDPLPLDTLRSPFVYTKGVILRMTRQSLDAARRGAWKVGAGGSIPFLSRGAQSLALMEQLLRDDASQRYVCAVTPLSCKVRALPKKALVKAFSKLYQGKVPKGLEFVVASSKRDIAAFQSFVNKLPDRYTACK